MNVEQLLSSLIGCRIVGINYATEDEFTLFLDDQRTVTFDAEDEAIGIFIEGTRAN